MCFFFFSNNVGSYNPRSHLPPMILRRISILTTLHLTVFKNNNKIILKKV